MKLLLIRDDFGKATRGKLFVNGNYQCETLEDMDRKLEEGGVKIPGQTAIPRGTYQITLDYSNRFQRTMAHILNVPGFEGIRIHCGNTPANTEGCILVGKTRGNANDITLSRVAYDELFPKLQVAFDRSEPITIEIK